MPHQTSRRREGKKSAVFTCAFGAGALLVDRECVSTSCLGVGMLTRTDGLQHWGVAELHGALGHPDERGGAPSAGRRTRQQTPADSGVTRNERTSFRPCVKRIGRLAETMARRAGPDNFDRQDAEARDFS